GRQNRIDERRRQRRGVGRGIHRQIEPDEKQQTGYAGYADSLSYRSRRGPVQDQRERRTPGQLRNAKRDEVEWIFLNAGGGSRVCGEEAGKHNPEDQVTQEEQNDSANQGSGE